MMRSNWVLDPGKFLTSEEATRLLETTRKRAAAALAKGNKAAVRHYFVVDLALSTGLRVMEISQLKCGDIFLRGPTCMLLVRNGKGGKKRQVRFNGAFRRHFEEYICWKRTVGEPTEPGSRLVCRSAGIA
ncbi:MAG: tyrosine-type recombinase/integrase [Planctomycetota bacterium]|jgi:integrase